MFIIPCVLVTALALAGEYSLSTLVVVVVKTYFTITLRANLNITVHKRRDKKSLLMRRLNVSVGKVHHFWECTFLLLFLIPKCALLLPLH